MASQPNSNRLQEMGAMRRGSRPRDCLHKTAGPQQTIEGVRGIHSRSRARTRPGAGDPMREPQAARRRRETRNANKRSVHSNGDASTAESVEWRSRLRARLAQDRVEGVESERGQHVDTTNVYEHGSEDTRQDLAASRGRSVLIDWRTREQVDGVLPETLAARVLTLQQHLVKRKA